VSKVVVFVAAAAVVLAVAALRPPAARGPEEIAYGRDVCGRCRMILSRPGFAGEIRDRNGVLVKYDDIGCMLEAMLGHRGEIPEAWVEDHRSGRLVPLLRATLVRSPSAATPMDHGIVAFEDASAARALAVESGGEVVALEQLVRDRNRLARAGGDTHPARVP
jgi:copper chaperone NosL